MLHLRDISLRHRLLIANFTMVFVPIFILTVLGFLLVSGLRFSSPHNDLMTLWPEKGPALSIQYTVSSLRVKAERPGPLKLNDLREDCQVLESLGIATAIIRHDQVAYVTPGVDFYGLADRVLQKAHGQKTVMTWDGDGFFFRYSSPHSGTTIIAAGNTPFIAKTGIREAKEVPILMVSAKREDMDKIRGLGLGADDYIIKPFSPTELVARVKAHIQRYERLTGKARPESGSGEVLRSGDLEIYVDKHRVYVKGREISLTNREFELLVFLAKHPGLVFSRDRLFERVWDLDAEGDTATVMVHINRIREKIEPDPAKPIYIETVWGAGYRFKEA